MGIFLQRESRSLEKGEREIERERKDSSFFFSSCFGEEFSGLKGRLFVVYL